MEAINIYPDLMTPNKQGLAAIVIRFDFGRKHIGTDAIKQKVDPVFGISPYKEKLLLLQNYLYLCQSR